MMTNTTHTETKSNRSKEQKGNAMTRDEKVCHRINTIRKDAGNPLTSCPICEGSEYGARRRVVDGSIVEGCVDSFHVEAASIPSGYAQWFNRSEAKQLRKETLDSLR